MSLLEKKEKILYQSSFHMGFSYPSGNSKTNPTDNLRFFKSVSLKKDTSDSKDISYDNTVIDLFSSLFFLSPFNAVIKNGKIKLTFFLLEDENKFPNHYIFNERKRGNNFNDFLLYFSRFFRNNMESNYDLKSMIDEFYFEEKEFDNQLFLKNNNESKKSYLQQKIIKRIKKEIEFIEKKIESKNSFKKTTDELRKFFIDPEELISKKFFSFSITMQTDKNCDHRKLDKILYLISSNLNFTRYNCTSYLESIKENFNSSDEKIKIFKRQHDISLSEEGKKLFKQMQTYCNFVIQDLLTIDISTEKVLDMKNFFYQMRTLKKIKEESEDKTNMFFAVCSFILLETKGKKITRTNFCKKYNLFIIHPEKSKIDIDEIIDQFETTENLIRSKNIAKSVLFETIIFNFPYVIKSFTKSEINIDNFSNMLIEPRNKEKNSIPNPEDLEKNWWLANLSTFCSLKSSDYSTKDKKITFLNKRSEKKTIVHFKSNETHFNLKTIQEAIETSDIFIFDSSTLSFIFDTLKNYKIEEMISKRLPVIYFLRTYMIEERTVEPEENKLNLEKFYSESFRKNRSNYSLVMFCVSSFGIRRNQNDKLEENLGSLLSTPNKEGNKKGNKRDHLAFIRETTKIYLNLKYVLYSNTMFSFNLMPVIPGNSLSFFPLEEKLFFDFLITKMNDENKKFFYRKKDEIEILLRKELSFSNKRLNCNLPENYEKETSRINSLSFDSISTSLLFNFLSPFAFPDTINESIKSLEYFDKLFQNDISTKRTVENHNNKPIIEIEKKYFGKKQGIIYYFFNFPKIMDMMYEKYSMNSNCDFNSENPFLSYMMKQYIFVVSDFIKEKKLVLKGIFQRGADKTFFVQKLNTILSQKALLSYSPDYKFFISSYEDMNDKEYLRTFSEIENKSFTKDHLFISSPVHKPKNKNFIGFHLPSLSICEILLLHVFDLDNSLYNSDFIYDNRNSSEDEQDSPVSFVDKQKQVLFKLIIKGKKYYPGIGKLDFSGEDIEKHDSRKFEKIGENVLKILEDIKEVKKTTPFPLPQDIYRNQVLKLQSKTVEGANAYIALLFSTDVVNAKNLNSLIICGYYLFLNSSDDYEKSYIISKISSVFLPSIFNVFSKFINSTSDLPIKKEKDKLNFDSFAGKNNFLDMGYHTENNIFFKKEEYKYNNEDGTGNLSF